MNRFRLSSIALLALASSLGWVPPTAAIDLTNYVPFQAELTCTGNPCINSLSLPVNKITVLEYISFGCNNIPFGGKLDAVLVSTIVNGTQALHALEIPVAASLGDAPNAAPSLDAPNGVAQSGQVVRIYADPNSQITVDARITGSNLFFGCGFAFSGEQSPVLPP